MTVPGSTQTAGEAFLPCLEPFQAFKQIPYFATEQNAQVIKKISAPEEGDQLPSCHSGATHTRMHQPSPKLCPGQVYRAIGFTCHADIMPGCR